MNRWGTVLGAVAVLALACSAPAAQPDPIKTKLDKVRTAYEDELTALDKNVTDALDKAEAAARKAGDKKALDKVKADRELFELTGAVPKSVSPTLAAKVLSAHKTLETALASAVKEYTKAKKDDEAAAADKERTALKGAGAVRPRYFLIVNKNSGLVLAVTKENGELGSGVVQAKNTGADNQVWSFVPNTAGDAFLLRNRASGYCAGIPSRTPGHGLSLEKETGTSNRWVLEREGFSFLFQNTSTKLYMAVGEARKEEGAFVVHWQKIEKADEQRWNLVAAKPK